MKTDQEAQWLDALLCPLYLYFNDTDLLEHYSGRPAYYGLREFVPGQTRFDDILPELIGIDTREANEFPLVTLANDATVDVHLKPRESGFDLMLLRADKTQHELQKLQQSAHDFQLKNQQTERLKKNVENLNEKLVESGRAKSLFISGMSHEFRTPIMGMLGNIAWVGKQLLNDSDSYQKIKAIEVNATYLLGLVDNLLQQGKISADQISISRKRVSPKRVFHSVLETMLPLAEKRSILLAHEIRIGDQLELLLDDYHMRRILYNLLGNAIKFTDTGSVLLEASYSNSELNVSVIDTGIGIAEEDIDKILLPFTRGRNVLKRRGIGLGLSYSHEIVKAMGGTMQIESRLDRGTTITLSLPVSDATEGETDNTHSQSSGHLGKVLLVEDSSEIISLYSYYFHDAGIDMAAVSNGADLFRALGRIAPKMLLVDHLLGTENGIDLVRELREQGYKGYIILLTASIDVEQLLEKVAIQAGCDEFIQKPAEVGRLVDTVKARLKLLDEQSHDLAPKKLIQEYVDSFPGKCDRLMGKLEDLHQNPDSKDQIMAMKIEVHKLSGSAGAYGFPEISSVSIELERIIKNYEEAGTKALLDDIEIGCLRLIKQFEQHIP